MLFCFVDWIVLCVILLCVFVMLCVFEDDYGLFVVIDFVVYLYCGGVED